MKSVTYHNTTDQHEDFVKKEIVNCKSQEEKVYLLFQNGASYTASEVYYIYKRLVNANVPLTSIRRAMSNLKHEDRLIKTEKQHIGMYGKPEYVYKSAVDQIEIKF